MRLPILSLCAAERVAFGLLVVGLMTAAGCGEKGIPCNPVHGSVNVDGKPADGAMVIFCPVGGSEQVQKTRPYGFTGSDGKFELLTVKKDDGAPAGDYKVIIQWPAKSSNDPNSRSLGGDRLHGRYMNLEKSQLTATVKQGSNDLPPFELKSQ